MIQVATHLRQHTPHTLDLEAITEVPSAPVPLSALRPTPGFATDLVNNRPYLAGNLFYFQERHTKRQDFLLFSSNSESLPRWAVDWLRVSAFHLLLDRVLGLTCPFFSFLSSHL
jgi:hypothetical protein